MKCFSTSIAKPDQGQVQTFFFGRKALLQTVQDRFQDGSDRFESYYGINKSGKTWFFSALQFRMEEAFRQHTGSVYPVYVDAGAVKSGQLLRSIFGSSHFSGHMLRDIASRCESISPEDLLTYVREIDSSSDENVIRTNIEELLDTLKLFGIRILLILDECQAFLGKPSDLTHLNYLTTLPVSIALVGRINADTIYRRISLNNSDERTAALQKVPFNAIPLPGFNEDDLKEYWSIFPNKLHYYLAPSFQETIRKRAGNNPYLLALIGESIEFKLLRGRHDEITDEWLFRVNEEYFYNVFRRMTAILEAANQLDDLARCTSFFDHRLIPEMKKRELVDLGYLIRTKDGYQTISQDFQDFLIREFIEKGREDRIIRLAECYLSRAIVVYLMRLTGLKQEKLCNRDFSNYLHVSLDSKALPDAPILEKVTLAPKLWGIENEWSSPTIGGFQQFFQKDPYTRWEQHFNNLREYRNKDAHVGVIYEVPETITRKGIASARAIALQLSKQFAVWEG